MSDIEILLAAVFDETETKAQAIAPEAEAAKERARLGRRGPRGNSKRIVKVAKDAGRELVKEPAGRRILYRFATAA